MASLQSNIPGLVKQMRERASRLARETALSIEGDIKSDMAGPKSGRAYRRGKKTHQASAPGESPAIDDGVYAGSIEAVPVDETTSAVGTSDERGPLLELGGGRVAARPHFGPAFERAAPGFEEGLKTIFEG